MNKFLNIFLIFFHFPIILFCIIIAFNFNLDIFKINGSEIPYKNEIFFTISGFIAFIFIFRSIQRWMGIKMLSQKNRFQWNVAMNKSRSKQVITYLILESAVQIVVAIGLVLLTPYALSLTVVLLIFSLDHLVLAFLGYQKKLFRVGMTKKAILAVDRDVKTIYFKGLTEVDNQQNTLFFEFINGLQLSIPSDAISKEDRKNFYQCLESILDRNKVFFSENFKKFTHN